MENKNLRNCKVQNELPDIPTTVIYRKNISKSFLIDSLLSNNDEQVEKDFHPENKRLRIKI